MTNQPTPEVLAKSEPLLTLQQHIDDCLLISRYLQKCFPQITALTDIDIWRLLHISILFHDLGKAHKEFQKVLSGKAHNWNFQRHELFSLPFVDAFNINPQEKELIKLVVAGHHKDFDKLHSEYIVRHYKEKDDETDLLDMDDEDKSFETAFEKNVPVGVVKNILSFYKITIGDVSPSPIQPLVRRYLKNKFTQAHPQYFQLLLLFGAMKHCDHMGSARISSIPCIEPADFTFLEKQRQKLLSKNEDFYPHQNQCAKVTGNLILTSPTGSGKTESALLWLQKQMAEYGQGRVFYILPFTASINAMYERLGENMGGDTENPKVGMLHGKLSDYLNDYFEDFQYSISKKKEEIESIKDKFRTLLTPVKVVTPFQLLKHLFGLKGFEQGIIEWTGGYFIFDEIHAYSPEVFAQIKVLIEFATKYLHTKVMVMTATMPSFLRKELVEAIGSHCEVEADADLYKSFVRHRVVLKDGLLSQNLSLVRNQLESGKKVLVVCNTVHEAQQTFESLKSVVGNDKAVLLHSGFNGRDRSIKEKELKKEHIQLLVGTQAIEVSLDIDYDMIFTEPAPIDALIQRFGRVNRRRGKGICPCYIFKERNKADQYIYSQEVVDKTLQAFERIEKNNKGIIEEEHLQELIDFVYPDWDEKSAEKFQRIYIYLTQALQELSPLLHSKHTEEDFYKQFDGIKVLPQECKSEFTNHLNNFDFISAESLKVQIRKNNFAAWLKNGFLQQGKYVFEAKTKTITIPYYITNKPYNSEVGLQAKGEINNWENDNLW